MRLSPLLAVVVLAHSWEIDEILSPLPPLSQAFRFPSGDDGAIKTSGAPPLSQTPQIDESLPIQQAEDDDQAAVAPWPEPLSLTQRRVPSVPPPPSPRQRVNRRISDAPPQVCLAFLSCCGRTDLLERTLAAALAHMEDDEPTVRGFMFYISRIELNRSIARERPSRSGREIGPVRPSFSLARGGRCPTRWPGWTTAARAPPPPPRDSA